ncbi:PepSY domain-containing protein [Sulfobacillus thermosulfidooxidans]|uniref:PepSY domain-containing protein n=1 Tax=Sulfobacillus thermosulfidooxidans TaxID=28034 RepID=UPI0006B659A5|nr:PepSY domain-containing protein [Sulfobacillus thermosulfidooxidans]
MKQQIWLGAMAAAGLISLPLAAPSKVVPSVTGTFHGASTFTATSYRISRYQAGQNAISRVGGGQIVHISNDTYHGQAVYDIHVFFHRIVYDVKISQMSGQVVEMKRSSEQPGIISSIPPTGSEPPTTASPTSPGISLSQAEHLALKALGGGGVVHISLDHFNGAPIFDVHVKKSKQMWDVKISQSTGAVIDMRLATENTVGETHSGSSHPQDQTPQSSDSQDTTDSKTGPSVPSANGTIAYGIKMRTVPSAYQSYVTSALQQENGTLKWIKFIHKDNGDIEVNIKIRRYQGGSIKVKDLFNSSGQLIQQTLDH